MSSRDDRARRIKDLDREMRHFMVRFALFNQQVADEVGLNPADLQCLHIVKLLNGATPGQISGHTNLTTGGVTVMLDRLERSGYVRREPNPDDRRSIIVRAQEGRLQRLYAIYRSKQEEMERVLAPMTDEELATVIDFFSRMRREETPEDQ